MDLDSGRYELRRVSEMEWAIHDRLLDDARRVVARIFEVDAGECEVVWVRDVGLRTVYGSPADAMEELRAVRSRSTKPIYIPHRPPFEPTG